jgi:hypothetical protein
MKEVDDNEFMKMVASGGDNTKKREGQPTGDNLQKNKNTPGSKIPAPDYTNMFIQRSSEGEKSTVYLSKDLISQLKNILATIGGDKATLGGYVEAIIAAHFEQYKDEIIRLFNENIKQPFQ